jgi:regulator of replication initiation timing
LLLTGIKVTVFDDEKARNLSVLMRVRALKYTSAQQLIDHAAGERLKGGEWVDDLTTSAFQYLDKDGIRPEGVMDNPRLSNVDVMMCFERSGVRSLLGNLFGSSASSSSSSSSGGTPRDVRIREISQVLPGFPKSTLRLKADVERRLASSQIDPKRVVTLVIGGGFPVGTGEEGAGGPAPARWSVVKAAVARRVVVVIFEDPTVANFVLSCLQTVGTVDQGSDAADLSADEEESPTAAKTEIRSLASEKGDVDSAPREVNRSVSPPMASGTVSAAVASASTHVSSSHHGRKPKRRQVTNEAASAPATPAAKPVVRSRSQSTTPSTRAEAAAAAYERRQSQAAMQQTANMQRLETSVNDLSNAVAVERANYQTLLSQYMEQNNEYNDMCEANKTLAKETQSLKAQLTSKDQMFKEDTKTKYKMSRKLENAVMENAENRRQIAELVRSTFFCCLIYSLFRIFTTPCLAGANYTGI